MRLDLVILLDPTFRVISVVNHPVWRSSEVTIRVPRN
jgi:hypothetical protein